MRIRARLGRPEAKKKTLTPEQLANRGEKGKTYYQKHKKKLQAYQRAYGSLYRKASTPRGKKDGRSFRRSPKSDYSVSDLQNTISPGRTEEMIKKVISGEKLMVGFRI